MPISLDTADTVSVFLGKFAPDFPKPKISVEPSGNTLIDWQRDAEHVVSIIVDGDGGLFYAIQNGNERYAGKVGNREPIPQSLIGQIRGAVCSS